MIYWRGFSSENLENQCRESEKWQNNEGGVHFLCHIFAIFSFWGLETATDSSRLLFLSPVETLSQPVSKGPRDFVWLPQLTMQPLQNSSHTHTHARDTNIPKSIISELTHNGGINDDVVAVVNRAEDLLQTSPLSLSLAPVFHLSQPSVVF